MRVCPLLLVVLAACPSSRESPRPVRSESAAPGARAVASAPASSAPCPERMLPIPAATFMMGTTLDDPNDRLHQVTLSKPYCIDRTPVTVAEYRQCVEAK